jgi:hypothetical protein
VRTLLEIVEGAKDGNKPTHDECYWAMLALDSLRHFNQHELISIYEAAEGSTPNLILRAKMGYPESFNREKRAFAKDPQAWVGPSHDPSNPECQKMRDMAFKVFEKATGEKLR